MNCKFNNKTIEFSLMSSTHEMTLTKALQKHFGFDAFKGEQEQVMKSILDNKDTLVIMPTCLVQQLLEFDVLENGTFAA